MEYDISGLDEVFVEMTGFDEMDWWEFEEKMLTTVKKVTFLICGRKSCPALRAYFLERLPVFLPRLQRKGILQVKYIVGMYTIHT